jgi:hypothetical protein
MCSFRHGRLEAQSRLIGIDGITLDEGSFRISFRHVPRRPQNLPDSNALGKDRDTSPIVLAGNLTSFILIPPKQTKHNRDLWEDSHIFGI